MRPCLTQPPQHPDPGHHTLAVPCTQGAKGVSAGPTTARAFNSWHQDEVLRIQTARSSLKQATALWCPRTCMTRLLKAQPHQGRGMNCAHTCPPCAAGCPAGRKTGSSPAQRRSTSPQVPTLRGQVLPVTRAQVWCGALQPGCHLAHQGCALPLEAVKRPCSPSTG